MACPVSQAAGWVSGRTSQAIEALDYAQTKTSVVAAVGSRDIASGIP
jgi:hypothetical protein